MGEGGADGISGEGIDVIKWLFYIVKSFRDCRKCSLLAGKENEPMMANKAKFFPSNYTNRVVHLFTALLQIIVNIC